jgi:hypothetical protein
VTADLLRRVVTFYDWANERGDRLTPDAIRRRFRCSRATSYRWLSAFNDAQRALVSRRVSR